VLPRRSLTQGLLASASLTLLGAAPAGSTAAVDLVIAGGTVMSGAVPRGVVTDVVVDRGVIVHVGEIPPGLVARRTIDARGLVVCPGFVDLHAHGNVHAHGRNFLAMGVTTIVLGQDGQSPDGRRMRELKRRHGHATLAVNVVPLAGHATVRALAGIGHRRSLGEAQLEKLERLVTEELRDGAFGLSTALEYEPGAFASREELARIARPVAAADAIVMSHLRSEDDDAIDAALDELLGQAASSGARVHVAHLKIVHATSVERAERLLRRLRDARAGGLRVTADAYPYEASYTTLGILFPSFAKPPHIYAEAVRARRDELLLHLRQRVTKRGGPAATLFGTDPYRGKTLDQVAREQGKPFEEVLLELGPNGGSAAYFVLSPLVQRRLLVEPKVMVGSDGSHATHHPRGHGTFARVLRELVVERRELTLAEAIAKMSVRASETVGLLALKRGLLDPGFAADLLVFDPADVKDEATYERPQVPARGMRWVIVNGVAAIAEGKPTTARGGRLLLRT
jgi:N-acyl-D-amino-acid deacylase